MLIIRGRLLLGHLNAEEIRALIPAEDFILDNGVSIEFDEFLKDVQAAKEQGYCCTEGLSNAFRLCMAASISDRARLPIAGLCFMTAFDARLSGARVLKRRQQFRRM